MSNFLSHKIVSGTRMHKEITRIIQCYFQEQGIIVSNSMFQEKPTKLTISLFYYSTKPSFSENDLQIFTNLITGIVGKEVSLIITRVHYPYINSSIFAQYLAHNSSANTFVHFQNAIMKYARFSASDLPSHICGIRVQLSGRLATERIIPRVTKNSTIIGSLSGADYIDYAHHTQKNYLGTFTIKV